MKMLFVAVKPEEHSPQDFMNRQDEDTLLRIIHRSVEQEHYNNGVLVATTVKFGGYNSTNPFRERLGFLIDNKPSIQTAQFRPGIRIHVESLSVAPAQPGVSPNDLLNIFKQIFEHLCIPNVCGMQIDKGMRKKIIVIPLPEHHFPVIGRFAQWLMCRCCDARIGEYHSGYISEIQVTVNDGDIYTYQHFVSGFVHVYDPQPRD